MEALKVVNNERGVFSAIQELIKKFIIYYNKIATGFL